MDNQAQQNGSEKSEGFSGELGLIPLWSVAAAVLAFTAMEWVMWVVVPAHRRHPPNLPFWFRFYFDISIGALAALYMLMVGYISRDSPRRGMSTTIWTIVCVVIPSGIGAVLYFLLRQPILSRCPACDTRIESDYHFCPQCAYQVAPCCGNCHRTARITDLYCVHCGHHLLEDHPPARLHAFAE
ncbi:MAG TPA: PLDc N-terminal domain-containing protein [Acidobacteriaceae bacterium]|jgi:hypothetical protein|nr:PLDc N-terminal domain-containing protein [Acidobacteriaceae bacterium]